MKRRIEIVKIPEERLMPIGRAAEYAGQSIDKMRDLADTGQLRCKNVSGRRYFLLEDLDAWIAGQPDWYIGTKLERRMA